MTSVAPPEIVFPAGANASKRDYAIAYLSFGWSVIPILPGDKRPAIAWKRYETERADLPQIDHWLRQWPAANIGIVTGDISGVAVLDLDGDAGIANLRQAGIAPPATLLQRTPRGWHAFYATNGAPIKTAAGILPHVDIRGDGGLVVITPSVRPDGAYRWHRQLPIASAPLWMEEQRLLQGRTVTPDRRTASTSTAEQWIVVALANGAPNGQRNATATRLAGYLHARRLPSDVIVALMGPFAARCSPPIDDRELWTIVASVSRYATGGAQAPPTTNFLALEEPR